MNCTDVLDKVESACKVVLARATETNNDQLLKAMNTIIIKPASFLHFGTNTPEKPEEFVEHFQADYKYSKFDFQKAQVFS